MKNIFFWFVLVVSIALIASSCAKDDSSSSSTDNTTSSSDDSSSTTDNSSSPTELEGSWKTVCYPNSDNSSFSEIETLTMAGNALTIKNEKHSDTSCATDYRLKEETHTFSIGDAVTFASGQTGHYFTLTIGSTIKRTPQSASAVSSYNSASKCSASNWELNTEKECSEADAGLIIKCLYLLDNNTFYADCNNPDSYPTGIDTSDAAHTWIKDNSTSTSDNSSSSSGSGVFVAVGGISSGSNITTYAYKSTDNGSTWDNASIPYVGKHGSSSIAFGDNTFVSVGTWAGGNSLIRSTDNGSTWDNVTGGQEGLSGVAYGNNTFVAVNKYITRSTDNGTTWDNASAPTGNDISVNENFLWEIAFGNNSFVAVGSYGNIIRSTNNGSSWDNATWVHTVDINSTLSDVAFGNNTFVAVGWGNKIIRSTDNGSTWDNATVPSGINRFNDVAFGNNTFVAITSVCGPCKSYVVRSTDNGSSWDNGTISVGTLQIRDVAFGNGVFIITSEGGLILRSTDNGSTWDNMTQYDSNLPNITAVGISN